jgi:hypothetical protein
MNERILELEDQCWVKVPCDFDMNAGGLSTIRTVFDRKKFAELLIEDTVRKCADYAEYQLQIGGTNADKIKQHFGVD